MREITHSVEVALKCLIAVVLVDVGRHLEKSQKSRYLRNGLTDLYNIWYADAEFAP